MPDLAELLRDAFTRLYGDQAAAGGLLGQAQAPAPAGGGVLGQAVRQPQPQPFADIDQAIAAAAPTPTRPAGAPEPPLGPEPYGFPPGQGAGPGAPLPPLSIDRAAAMPSGERAGGVRHGEDGAAGQPGWGGCQKPTGGDIRDPAVRRQMIDLVGGMVGPGALGTKIMGGRASSAGGDDRGGGQRLRRCGPAANAPGMLPEVLKQSIEAQQPRTFADYVIQRTQGMAPADVLQSDALWAKAQDMASATGRPFNEAFAQLAGAAGAPMTPQAAQTYINAQRAQLSGIRAVPEGGTGRAPLLAGERGRPSWRALGGRGRGPGIGRWRASAGRQRLATWSWPAAGRAMAQAVTSALSRECGRPVPLA